MPNQPPFSSSNQPTRETLHRATWQKLRQDDVKSAVALCQQLNASYPNYADGWHVASNLALKLRNPPKALEYIEKAIAIQPSNIQWKLQKAQSLQAMGRIEEAMDIAKMLSKKSFSTAIQYSSLGGLLTQQTEYQLAHKAYQAAIKIEPEVGQHYYNRAAVERFMGDMSAAEKSCDRAIHLNPKDYEAHLLRSELRKQKTDNNHTDELEQIRGKEIPDWRGRVQICHALAKEYEDLGEYEKSFARLKEGADTRRKHMRYDVSGEEQTIEKIIQVYGPQLFDGSVAGDSNEESIFIIGLPRTGTTLVERILGSHSQVHSAGELNNFAQQLVVLSQQMSRDKQLSKNELVSQSAKLDFSKLGKAYIDSTRPYTGHTKHFIDKLPLNYLYTGLIHLALPKAKIVHLARHPLDTCYAIYKRLFKDAYPFSYNLEDLGRYYVAYHKLMEHWYSVIPGKIHRLSYECLVGDTEGETRKLLEFCDLPWEQDCLQFYKSKAASTTASAAQVRQPIYNTSVQLWRKYEQQLSPLIKILDNAGIEF